MENKTTNINNKTVCMKVNDIFKEKFSDYRGCSNFGDNISLYFEENPELAKLDNSALCIEGSRYRIKHDYLEFFLQLRIATNSNIYRTEEVFIERDNKNVPVLSIHDLDFNKIIKLEK